MLMRWTLVTIMLLNMFGCAAGLMSQTDSNSATKDRVSNKSSTISIDGVYEFVSRTTTVEEPDKSSERLSAPEWFGLWIFHDGYFSQTRMMNIRPDWTPARFPNAPTGLGFDGSSGTYSIKDDTLELKHMVNFYPGTVGAIEDVKYHFENETLTLTLDLIPGPESRAKGQRVIVLRKIKQ
jgi:hypothetical protein